MRVSRLEIFGFKSFVERFVLEFDHDLICIVGPNGCGKSNIVDAIRWVLGETHAKQLRGGTLEDLIFNGSDSRRAMGMAEVSLTIRPSEGWSKNSIVDLDPQESEENAQPGLTNLLQELPGLFDATELQFTRRLYRSGESEFFINKIPCRLRDMVEIYRLLGLGARGLSIVQQGEIGELIAKKPIERRELLEEAAGISGFRSRIESANKRLEKTKENLSRLNDIVLEVDKQVKNLKRQAARAKNRQELKESIQQLDRELFLIKCKDNFEKRSKLEFDLEQLTKATSSFRSNLSLNDAKQEDYRAIVQELDIKLISLRHAREDLYRKIRSRKDRLHSFELEIASTKAGLDSLTSSLERLLERERLFIEQRQELSNGINELDLIANNLKQQEAVASSDLLEAQAKLKEYLSVNDNDSGVKFKSILVKLTEGLAVVVGKINSIAEFFTKDSYSKDQLEKEIHALRQTVESCVVNGEELNSAYEQNLISNNNSALEAFVAQERIVQDTYRKAQTEYAGAASKLSASKFRLQEIVNQLEEIYRQREDSSNRKQELTSRLEELIESSKQFIDAGSEGSSDAEDYELQLAEQRIVELENDRADQTRLLAQEAQGVSEVRRELDTLIEKESVCKLSLERIRLELDLALEDMRRKYGEEQDFPSPEDIAAFTSTASTSTLGTPAELKQELDKLIKRLEREGEVDPESITLYEQEQQRLDSMQTEKDDLEKAVATLERTIDRLKVISRERFIETYNVVSQKFSELVPRLFGGGVGSMQLVSPEDPLTSGIELNVRPPGKKITSMDLMSGGEKALVATAVLISVFLHRPGPLCVLDEVDAPLDDANLERFLGMIREISSSTQFLMITHNKVSMAAADRLIGVTMQEKGISTALSVSFTEAEREIEKWSANA